MLSGVIDRALSSIAVRRLYESSRDLPAVGSAFRRLAHQLSSDGAMRWVKVPNGLAQGFEMLVDPRYELRYLRGDHEPWIQDLLSNWLRPGDAFYDVGAHVGFFSLCAAGLVGPRGIVRAFEPDSINYARLTNNLSRNRVMQVVPVRAAVWSREGRVRFESANPYSSRVEGKVKRNSTLARATLCDVDAVTLDSYLEDRGGVAKVDVEGAEEEVLDGAKSLLDEGRTKWIVEVHSGTGCNAVIEKLASTGHDPVVTSPVHAVYPTYSQQYVLATPRKV